MRNMIKLLKISLFLTVFVFSFIPDVSYGQSVDKINSSSSSSYLLFDTNVRNKTTEERQADMASIGSSKNLEDYQQKMSLTTTASLSSTSKTTSASTNANKSTSTSTGSTATGSASGKNNGNVDIFVVLHDKIYSTLVDLRRIVYVIAGFGLVMFAVLAIFNKVSYKHLGYIMISLCLLSLMFPFLEYFSGLGTIQTSDERGMDYKNFLGANYTLQEGTDGEEIVAAMNGKGKQGDPSCNEEGCESPEDAELDALEEDENKYGDEEEEERYLTSADLNKAKVAGCDVVALNNTGEAKSEWNDKGVRNVCKLNGPGDLVVVTETCAGKVDKKGKCVKTAAQTWSDIVSGTMSAANFVASGVNTVTSAVGTGMALYNGATNIANAAAALGNAGSVHDALGGLQNLAGATSGATLSTTAGFQSVLGGLGGGASSISNLATIASTDFETNPTGQNSVSEGAAVFDKNLTNVNQTVSTTAGNIDTALGQGSTVVGNVDRSVTYVEGGINTLKSYGQ